MLLAQGPHFENHWSSGIYSDGLHPENWQRGHKIRNPVSATGTRCPQEGGVWRPQARGLRVIPTSVPSAHVDIIDAYREAWRKDRQMLWPWFPSWLESILWLCPAPHHFPCSLSHLRNPCLLQALEYLNALFLSGCLARQAPPPPQMLSWPWFLPSCYGFVLPSPGF